MMDGESEFVGGSYIEGFGDDFVQVAVVISLVLSPLIICLLYWW